VNTPALLNARGLAKSYAGYRVLDDVTFGVARGEAVAVVGENGAGKSTLAKILAGAIRPDTGDIFLEGERLALQSPRDALRHGVSFIPQELAYLPNLTVAENIFVGQWPSRFGLTSPRAIRAHARSQADRFGISLDVRQPMAALSLAERQLVEIVKALTRSARLIVLDEPTASLSDNESARLFAVLGGLTQQGVGVIYISHRMDEVYRFSDRVLVLRNGQLVASVSPRTCPPTELIVHMLGQQAEPLAPAAADGADTQPVLEVLGWRRSGTPPLADVTMSVRRGEIVGLFGRRGSGAELVAEGLAGRRRDIQGEVVVDGRRRRVFTTPRAARLANLSVVPPERKSEGLVLSQSVQANVALQVTRALARWGLLNGAAERAVAASFVARLAIRHRRLEQKVVELSGGNQQKVLIASRLANKPSVLVLQEPTRGVDVGARVEIQRSMRAVAEEGTGVLWVTSDVEEVVAVSDRVVVMRDGKVVCELRGSDKTQARALAAATMDAA
jgi:ABC-type sugar transport system ATPase subunit